MKALVMVVLPIISFLFTFICRVKANYHASFVHTSPSLSREIRSKRKRVVDIDKSRKMAADKDESSASTFEWAKEGNLTKRTIQLTKPLGIVLEEIDAFDSTAGVIILEIDPKGNAAAAFRRGDADICLYDKILAVNNRDVEFSTFENVMDQIITSEGNDVSLTLGRAPDTITVRWPNGVGVAAKPGDHFCDLAGLAKCKIPYGCTNGGCGTCEQSIVTDKGDQRYVRPCVSRVPKGLKFIDVNP
mmetsp:Transcript_28633/g.41803  ORF Transcript_28633/g.41803 Transcript_28633/m.41803 type:complete len:245 (-) Transcript_28633:719-1453(-)